MSELVPWKKIRSKWSSLTAREVVTNGIYNWRPHVCTRVEDALRNDLNPNGPEDHFHPEYHCDLARGQFVLTQTEKDSK